MASIGLNFVGFGAAFLDYDNDGAEDLLIVNGHVLRHPPSPQTLAQRAVLFHNPGPPGQPSPALRFEDVSLQAGPFFQGKHRGRGLAVGDLDNRGKIDAVVGCCDEPATLLRNAVDNGNHWLGIQLQGEPYRDAVDARLTLEVGGRRLVRGGQGRGQLFVRQRSPRAVRTGPRRPRRSAQRTMARRADAGVGRSDADGGSLLEAGGRGQATASAMTGRGKRRTGGPIMSVASPFRSPDVRLLFITRAVRLFAYGFLALILWLYLYALGFTAQRIGLLLSMTMLGDVAVSLWITTTADRIGRKWMLILRGRPDALAGAAFLSTDDFLLLMIAATVGVISPSGNEVGPFLAIEQAALAQEVTAQQRTSVFAWYSLTGSLATAFGSLLCGLLVQFLHDHAGYSKLESYRIALWAYAGVGCFWRSCSHGCRLRRR